MNVETINNAIREVQEHFHEWKSMSFNPIELCSFAYYEGCGSKDCCSEILEKYTPTILLNQLISSAGFVVLSGSPEWILEHPRVGKVSYSDIAEGKWYSDDDQHLPISHLSNGEIFANSFEKLFEASH